MTLDPERLRRDVACRIAARPADLGPGGRRLTGAMATVRDHLPAIEALRAEGAPWGDIAAALAAQGVTQGDRDPITARRLTALIASIRRQELQRARRPGLPRLRPGAAARDGEAPLALSPDLARRAVPPPHGHAGEEALRRAQFDRLQGLLRPDPSQED